MVENMLQDRVQNDGLFCWVPVALALWIVCRCCHCKGAGRKEAWILPEPELFRRIERLYSESSAMMPALVMARILRHPLPGNVY